jgi:hypothetical protein
MKFDYFDYWSAADFAADSATERTGLNGHVSRLEETVKSAQTSDVLIKAKRGQTDVRFRMSREKLTFVILKVEVHKGSRPKYKPRTMNTNDKDILVSAVKRTFENHAFLSMYPVFIYRQKNLNTCS